MVLPERCANGSSAATTSTIGASGGGMLSRSRIADHCPSAIIGVEGRPSDMTGAGPSAPVEPADADEPGRDPGRLLGDADRLRDREPRDLVRDFRFAARAAAAATIRLSKKSTGFC